VVARSAAPRSATRAWAALNPKAYYRDPITIADVLASPMISSPLHLLDCCLVTDAGGAVVVTSAERARDCKKKPVWVLGSGEATTHMSMANMPDLTTSPAAISGPRAFQMAGVRHEDLDVVEVYDSFTYTALVTLEALGFCKPGEGGAFVSGQRTAPGGDFPLNTNGGGLSYMHSGMYGMYALQESVRQMRGVAPAQVSGARIAVSLGVGGMFGAAGAVIFGNDA